MVDLHACAGNSQPGSPMKIDALEAYNVPQDILAIWRATIGPELLPVQERAIKEFGLLGDKNLVVASPTSSGKTFIGEMAAVKAARQNTKVISQWLRGRGEGLHRADDIHRAAVEHPAIPHPDPHRFHSFTPFPSIRFPPFRVPEPPLRALQFPESMTGRPSTWSGVRRYASTLAPSSRSMRVRW